MANGETPQAAQEKAAVLIANASLAPFLGLTLLSFLHIGIGFALQAMILYSLAVVCFLAGSWWGFTLTLPDIADESRRLVVITGSIIVLAAVSLVLFLDPTWTVFSLALVYVAVMFLERRLPGLHGLPPYYHAMRARVSMIAAGSHLLFGWAVSAV